MVLALGLVTLGGVLLVVLGLMGLLGKLPASHISGIRGPFATRSDENSYSTLRAAAPLFIFGGVAATMAGLAVFPFAVAGKVSDGLAASVCVAVAMLLGVTAIAAWFFGTRSARGSAQ